MTKKVKPEEKTPEVQAEFTYDPNQSYVLNLKPGSTAGKGLIIKLEQNQLELTVDEAIAYAMGQNVKRDGKRIQDAIKGEMAANYGVTANSEAVMGNRKIGNLFVKHEVPGEAEQTYMGLDLIIASKQTGGFGYVPMLRSYGIR
ncbi:hypothetical protein HZB02_01995 [Candidatus Woesearchaeota archaeon]|nr:hypothetical protein [Candidatus Woesearchaeota archaeon]